ncbi:hypothetical protein FB451DRAFT_1300858 [Mycena latifolia]|nr:hypothetical protein FB451DRAFT_1300858 [Mycena latifolia]
MHSSQSRAPPSMARLEICMRNSATSAFKSAASSSSSSRCCTLRLLLLQHACALCCRFHEIESSSVVETTGIGSMKASALLGGRFAICTGGSAKSMWTARRSATVAGRANTSPSRSCCCRSLRLRDRRCASVLSRRLCSWSSSSVGVGGRTGISPMSASSLSLGGGRGSAEDEPLLIRMDMSGNADIAGGVPAMVCRFYCTSRPGV